MPFIYQAVFSRLDEEDRVQRVVPLASSQIFEEPSNSLVDALAEQLPAIDDVCSLVEQKVTQKLADKEVKSIAVSKR